MEYFGVDLVHQATHIHKQMNAFRILSVTEFTSEFTFGHFQCEMELLRKSEDEMNERVRKIEILANCASHCPCKQR